jgi:type I restriction enzyme S subunit
MSAWIDTTIGEQVRLQRGVDLERADRRPGVIPVFSSGGLFGYHDRAIADGPGVFLG